METGFDLMTIPKLLSTSKRLYSSKTALIDVERGRSVTYGQLHERVIRLANALAVLGVRKGDKVGFMCYDRVECVEIMYAVNLLGAIWVPQNYRFVADELVQQMEHCDAETLFVDERCLEVCRAARNRLTHVKPTNYIAIGTSSCPREFHDYEAFLASGANEARSHEVTAEDVCGIIYTSGTTGDPKGAMHSHRSFIGWAMVPIMENCFTAEDRVLNVYPMFHMGGTVLSVVCLIAGCTCVVLGTFEPEKWLRTIQDNRISATCAVPTIMNAVTKLSPDVVGRYDLSGLKRLATSGAPLMTETQDAILRQIPHVKLYSYYSATEIFQSMLLPEDHARKVRCVGPAAYGMEVRILDDQGNELPAGEVGLIYARGISSFIGYYRNPQAELDAIRDGWVTCKDMGYCDDEGYLYIVDRKKDVINSGGEKIFSAEVENILLGLKGIREVAVVGVPDNFWGERVHAVVTLMRNADIGESEILDWCSDKMAGYKRPRSVEIRDELPKSPVGKILKRNIRDEFWKDCAVKI